MFACLLPSDVLYPIIIHFVLLCVVGVRLVGRVLSVTSVSRTPTVSTVPAMALPGPVSVTSTGEDFSAIKVSNLTFTFNTDCYNLVEGGKQSLQHLRPRASWG